MPSKVMFWEITQYLFWVQVLQLSKGKHLDFFEHESSSILVKNVDALDWPAVCNLPSVSTISWTKFY